MSAKILTRSPAIEAVVRGRAHRAGRRRLVILLLAVLMAAAFAVTLTAGRTYYPPGDVLRVVLGEQVPGASFFSRWNEKDDAAVSAALEATHTTALADRSVDELSGGQRQRVWIAMALAQQTDLLLLDEPTTFLDASHQVEVLDLLTDLNLERGTTIVMVLHDLNLAARYADHLIALANGRLHAMGSPAEVLTQENVHAVFGLDSRVIEDPVSGRPLMLPIGRHHVRPRADARTAGVE